MTNIGQGTPIPNKRRLPNELLAELCRSVRPLLGIWDDRRPPAASPRRTSNTLLVSFSMYAYLRHKFSTRKALEIENLEKCCRICDQKAWALCHVGPNKICIGCKCFFLRCVRDDKFADSIVCACSARQSDVPQMCKSCRLKKCVKIGLSPATIAVNSNKRQKMAA
uniref:Nuclear receptor domain-containing protein n=1 Tax=Globodera rostochiensis TaxID=31243 RepID=A0A914GTB4_GLORO